MRKMDGNECKEGWRSIFIMHVFEGFRRSKKYFFFCLTGNQTGSKVDVVGKKLGTGVKYCWNEMEIDKKL